MTPHFPGWVRNAHDVAEYVSGDGWQDGSRTQEEKRCELPEKGCIRELEDYDEKRECEIGRVNR